jgi:uncharacterized protein (DUF488 family)
MTIFTIGYEGLDIEAFLSLLQAHDVETIVDVRELPLSRKPGFSKKALAGVLNVSGFEYVHMAELGCPKPIRDRYRADGNWKRYTEGFLKHLNGQQNAIDELSELSESAKCALLCYEADYNFCHRSMVAAAVSDYCGASVRHIGRGEPKRANPVGSRLAFA